jgi:hypothetical protein
VKTRAANRNLFLGLVFVIGAIVAWMLAGGAYREQIGAVKSGNRVFKVTLEQVNQRRTLFPDHPLGEWLGAEQAALAEKQQTRYGVAFAACLVSGFLSILFLGLHLDALRAGRTDKSSAGAEPQSTSA